MNREELSRALFLLSHTRPGESAEVDNARQLAAAVYACHAAPVIRGELAVAQAEAIVRDES